MKYLLTLAAALLISTPAMALDTFEKTKVVECVDIDEGQAFLEGIGQRLVITGTNPNVSGETMFFTVDPKTNTASILLARPNKQMPSGIEACLQWAGKITPTD